MTRPACPPWCRENPLDGHLRHRGAATFVRATVEGRAAGGAHDTELVIELARARDEVAVWLYVGDGWTGFSLSLDTGRRLVVALSAALEDASRM